MKYALIGCGRIAINHIIAARNNGFDIVSLCDIDDKKICELEERTGISNSDHIRHYTDYRKMIEEQDLELISIATESGIHAQIALDCINKGINVIIEKPMAMSMEDANEIIRLSNLKGVKVASCHQNRFNLAVSKMREAAISGRLGKMSHGSVHVRWNRHKDYYDQAPWRGTWAQDGGALMNQCLHGIDLLQWLMCDKVIEVYGATRRQFHPYLEAEDVGVAILKFENGAVATIEGTTNVFPNNLEETLYLFGENGTVKLGGKSANNIEIWDFEEEMPGDADSRVLNEQTSNVYGNGHTKLFADMEDAIKNDRPPFVDAYAGRQVLELILAIYKSQKEGKPVNLPLCDFASTDMIGEFE